MNGRFNFRCPSYRCRDLTVGLAYALSGFLAGALVALLVGHPLLCVTLGGLAGLGAGAWLEAACGDSPPE
jgi:hypothetical protein